MRPLVFLVDSNSQSARVIRACLERANYRVREYFSADILRQIEELRPAGVLLDAALEDGQGLELCATIRRRGGLEETRVVLIVDRSSTECALGFKAGADDCLTRPVLPGELLARIEAVLRRSRLPQLVPEEPNDTVLKLGELELNLLALRVSLGGEIVPTTVLEFRLLEHLARNQGRVFTRDQLLDAVWGEERFVTPRSVDACVRRLRNKLEARSSGPSFLKTVRGVGYCLENTRFLPTGGDILDPARRRVS